MRSAMLLGISGMSGETRTYGSQQLVPTYEFRETRASEYNVPVRIQPERILSDTDDFKYQGCENIRRQYKKGWGDANACSVRKSRAAPIGTPGIVVPPGNFFACTTKVSFAMWRFERAAVYMAARYLRA
ncbi:hypothetical protein B0H19DRAFT_1067859 [Mycena capillaripes]|nr:hypothetical protein B0H19DRAFT_1067859 [Mycena capillaripes]